MTKRAFVAAALTAAALLTPIASFADPAAPSQPAASAPATRDRAQLARERMTALTTERRRPASEPAGYPVDASSIAQLVQEMNVGGIGGG